MATECWYCHRPLVRKAGETPSHLARRHYCDKICQHASHTLTVMTKGGARKRAQKAVPALVCERCGATPDEARLERHHHDYQKPTDVQVLCPKCHAAVEQGTGQRRTKPAKTCVICERPFTTYSHSRVRTCSAPCRSEAGRRAAQKRWGPPESPMGESPGHCVGSDPGSLGESAKTT